MTIARGAGWLAGRVLHVGVRDQWGGFRRGLQTGLVGMAVVAGGAGWVASHWWGDHLEPIMPPRSSAPAPATTHRLAGRLDAAGHCTVRGTVDGVAMTFLVDTGADTLSFNPDHMRRLGVNPAQLRYDLPIGTANGIGRAAIVTVGELRIGGRVLTQVPAAVDEAGFDMPLLGMSVLEKYTLLELGRGACALRW